MNKFSDYSTYLDSPGMLDYIEQEWKRKPELHKKQAGIVHNFCNTEGLKSIIEIGCSTGNAARLLALNYFQYTGLDANMASLLFAMMKNPYKQFIHGDIRKFDQPPRDLVFTFAVLKHFSLTEWPTIFKKILSLGDHAIFDIPLSIHGNKDDGTHYHHVWLTMEYVTEQVKACGHEILEVIGQEEVEPVFITKKVS